MKLRPIDWILMFGIVVTAAACLLVLRFGFDLQKDLGFADDTVNRINSALRAFGISI